MEKDTTKARTYVTQLVNQHGKERVRQALGISHSLLYRLMTGFGGSIPSKKTVRRLAEFTGEKYEDIMSKISPSSSSETESLIYSPVKNAVAKNALHYDTFERIYFSPEIGPDERYLITFYWLVSKGVKSLNTDNQFEVITPEHQEQALAECEKNENLTQNFKEYLGSWRKQGDAFIFSNAPSHKPPVVFVDAFSDLMSQKKRLQDESVYVMELEKKVQKMKELIAELTIEIKMKNS